MSVTLPPLSLFSLVFILIICTNIKAVLLRTSAGGHFVCYGYYIIIVIIEKISIIIIMKYLLSSNLKKIELCLRSHNN